MDDDRLTLWRLTYELTYRAWFGELALACLLRTWKTVDTIVGILTAVTSGGAAVAGWALWSQPGWRTLWAMLAGLAVLTSIAHTKIGIARVIEQLERAWSEYLRLRTMSKTLLDRLDLGLDLEEAKTLYFKLADQRAAAESAFKPGVIRPSRKCKRQAQEEVNVELAPYLASQTA